MISAFFALGPCFQRGTFHVFGTIRGRFPVFRKTFHAKQAVGGGEEGPPTSLPQLPPGTASRPACLDGRRCQSNPLPCRDPQRAFLLRRRRGSAPCGSYAAQLGVLASRCARSNLLEQCSHRDAASGRLSLRASLRSPLRTFALKSSPPPSGPCREFI